MKLVNQSCKIIEQESGSQGVYRAIEQAGRTCYKSEDKATNTSAGEFVDRMINSKHYAMLEFGTVYLKQSVEGLMNQINPLTDRYKSNKYSKVITVIDDDYKIGLGNTKFLYHTTYITTNLRVLVENDWLDDLKYICKPTEYHKKRITVKFICDRGVSHEFVRHRVFSFAQESTRYCNYSKDKFGNEITFIHPCWIEDNQDTYDRWCFYESLSKAEEVYFRLLKHGWTPQQARAVLPNALKTELVMTGFTSDWNHFFDLRARGTTGAPHPQAKELAEPLMKEFIARKYINN